MKLTEADIGKTMADTAKTAVQAERERQEAAREFAEMASGIPDADREMDIELKRAQVSKTRTEDLKFGIVILLS
jgi:hypothetical protein